MLTPRPELQAARRPRGSAMDLDVAATEDAPFRRSTRDGDREGVRRAGLAVVGDRDPEGARRSAVVTAPAESGRVPLDHECVESDAAQIRATRVVHVAEIARDRPGRRA